MMNKNLSNQKWIILMILLLILIPIRNQGQNLPDSSYAKVKRFSFGYGFGFNGMGLSITSNPEYEVQLTPHIGFNFHVSANFYVNQRIDLRILAGILFNQRDIGITYAGASPAEKTYPVESDILEFPIALKYKFLPEKNRTPYFLTSINPRFDLAGKDNGVGFQAAKPLLRSFDVYPEIGFGWDFQLRKLKFGMELKFSFGLLNVNLNPTDPSYILYSAAIKSSHSNMIILCFNFE